jgi:Ser/Thr protein kinase RdoA (MazF antagonist)
LFVAPVQTITGNDMVHVDGNYFRMFPFIKGSHTIDVAIDPASAYEAAKQFAAFTKKTSGLDATALKITLPDFHNLTLRYGQFENALNNGNRQRIETATAVIEKLKSYKDIVDAFEIIKRDPGFKIRVTHHDTKISNVLFDEQGKGLCVIDPDTIMPGYFISDVGDMLRTYLSPANEEETDMDKIEVRQEFLEAVIKGYLSEMKDELTEKEKAVFIYAGKFMIYMQALRFLTDYLDDDSYYGKKYEEHNLVRAKNQLVLLEKLIERANVQ